MNILGIIVGIIVFSFIYAAISTFSGSNTPKYNENQMHIDYIKMESDKAQEIFDWYKQKMIVENKDMDDICKNADEKREYIEISKKENELTENDDETYILALSSHFLTRNCDETATISKDIMLNPKEKGLFVTYSCALDTIQKIYSNIDFSGYKVSKNCLRVGSYIVRTNNVEGWKNLDKGCCFVTNQRIIFKGKHHVKNIPLGSILSIEKYEDDGVILFLTNREKPIILRFYGDKQFIRTQDIDGDYTRYFLNDMNDFTWALDKAYYQRNVPKEIQDMRKDMDEINKMIANAKIKQEQEKSA